MWRSDISLSLIHISAEGRFDLYQVGLAIVEHLRKVAGLFKVVPLYAPSAPLKYIDPVGDGPFVNGLRHRYIRCGSGRFASFPEEFAGNP